MNKKTLRLALIVLSVIAMLFAISNNVSALSEVTIKPTNPLSFEIKDGNGNYLDVTDPRGRIVKNPDGSYKYTDAGKVNNEYVKLRYLKGINNAGLTWWVTIEPSAPKMAETFKPVITEMVRRDNGGQEITVDEVKAQITNLPADVKEVKINKFAERVSIIDNREHITKNEGEEFDLLTDGIPTKQPQNKYSVKKDIDKNKFNEEQVGIITSVEPEKKDFILATIKFADDSEKVVKIPVKFTEKEREYQIFVYIKKKEEPKKEDPKEEPKEEKQESNEEPKEEVKEEVKEEKKEMPSFIERTPLKGLPFAGSKESTLGLIALFASAIYASYSLIKLRNTGKSFKDVLKSNLRKK